MGELDPSWPPKGPMDHGQPRMWLCGASAGPVKPRQLIVCYPGSPEEGEGARSFPGAPLFIRACGRAFGDRDPGPSLHPDAAGRLGGPELRGGGEGEVPRSRSPFLGASTRRPPRRDAETGRSSGAGSGTPRPAGLGFRLRGPQPCAHT